MPTVVAPSVFALTTGLFDTGSDFSTRRAEIVARNRIFSSKLGRRRRPNDLFHSTSRTQTSTKSLPPTPPIWNVGFGRKNEALPASTLRSLCRSLRQGQQSSVYGLPGLHRAQRRMPQRDLPLRAGVRIDREYCLRWTAQYSWPPHWGILLWKNINNTFIIQRSCSELVGTRASTVLSLPLQ